MINLMIKWEKVMCGTTDIQNQKAKRTAKTHFPEDFQIPQ